MSRTPGPWRLVPPPTADNGNPWRVAGGDHTIAIIPNRPREADARLIAAAPDLLAMCKELLRGYDEVVEDTGVGGGVDTDEARAAIAQAEGTA